MASRCMGFGSFGSQALEHRFNSFGSRAHLLCSIWDLPGPGIEPMSPALAGGFLTHEPPGNSPMAGWTDFHCISITFSLEKKKKCLEAPRLLPGIFQSPIPRPPIIGLIVGSVCTQSTCRELILLPSLLLTSLSWVRCFRPAPVLVQSHPQTPSIPSAFFSGCSLIGLQRKQILGD